MTGTECLRAALALLGETADSGAYYTQFALPCLNQLLANCQREIAALSALRGGAPADTLPRMAALADDIPADERFAAECLPYGLAALLAADDDKEKFNWAGSEFAARLLRHCPAQFTAVREML